MDNNTKLPQKRHLTLLSVLCASCLLFFSLFVIFCVKYYHKPVAASAVPESVTSPSVSDSPSLAEASKNEVLKDIKDELSEGTTVTKLLRQLYPNNIVYHDNNRYIFAEISNSLKKNNFQASNFIKNEQNEIQYMDNSKVVSYKGIDVSRYQGNIDWSKVKKSGIDYAMLRVGYRAYGSGVITDDSSFQDNLNGALANDIPVGVYFFTQAINEQEAKEEADYILNAIKGKNVSYPIVIDVEEIVNDTYRQQDLNREELTNIVVTFCERIKAAGYTPMVYGNLKCFIGKIDLSRLESYEKWFAQYDDTLYYPYEISMWQYTESGTIDGISGKVDLNVSFKKW